MSQTFPQLVSSKVADLRSGDMVIRNDCHAYGMLSLAVSDLATRINKGIGEDGHWELLRDTLVQLAAFAQLASEDLLLTKIQVDRDEELDNLKAVLRIVNDKLSGSVRRMVEPIQLGGSSTCMIECPFGLINEVRESLGE